MTTGNQIPPFRMDILTGPPTVSMGESQEVVESHRTLVGNGHCQQPLEKTASPMPEEKEPFKRAKPGTNIPTPGPIAWENHSSKRHAPPHSLQHWGRVPRKCLPAGSSFKKMWYLYTMPITQPWKVTTEIMKWCHWLLPGWSLEDHKLTKVNHLPEYWK